MLLLAMMLGLVSNVISDKLIPWERKKGKW